MNIAIYSRKSLYVEGSESIENQIQMCKDYIKRHLNVDETFVYEDEGFSGKNVDRPQFQRMMKDAEKKKFSILICYKLDRISRNISDFCNFIDELQKLDINFISIKEQFDTSTPMGRAMLYITSVFAQFERETIAERVKDNMIELAKCGRWLGGKAPLGYKVVGVKKDAKLSIDSSTSKLVLFLFNMYLKLDSLSALSKYCIRKNIKSANGNYFTTASLGPILRNPVYCIADEGFYNYAAKNKMIICSSKDSFINNTQYGVMCFNKLGQKNNRQKKRKISEWIISIGTHKGIVPSQKWVEVQEHLKFNSAKAPRTNSSETALLGGMIRCAKCGGSFEIVYYYYHGVRKKHYYKCHRKAISNGKLCNVKNIDGYEAEKMVLDFFSRLAANDKLIESLYMENKNTIKEDSFSELEKLKKKVKKNSESIEKLTEKMIYVENSVASKYLIKKIEELDKEIKDTNKEIQLLEDKHEEFKNEKINLDVVKQEIQYLSENIETLEFKDKKTLLRKIIKVIEWDGETLHIKI